MAGLGEDAAEGVGDEAAAPELDAGLRGVVAGAAQFDCGWVAVGGGGFEFDVAVLVADAVDGADEDSVGDGVGALDGLPGVVLGGAELFLLGGVPADGGGEEEGFGALEGGDAGAFGIPLVPADQGADGPAVVCCGHEAEVAGGEVELLVVEGVVGDVHLAVDVGDAAVLVDGDGGVVVEAGGAALEEAGDEDDAVSRRRGLRTSVEGPGMDSAWPKRAWSSRWQKYWARKSSGQADELWRPGGRLRRRASRPWRG